MCATSIKKTREYPQIRNLSLKNVHHANCALQNPKLRDVAGALT